MAQPGSAPARVYRGLAADERRAQRRARLLEAGLDLLAGHGWHATTVTAVCRSARLTPRYFYESFRDRDEFLVAVFEEIVEEVAQNVRAALEESPPSVRETVRANIAAWMKVANDDRRKARVAFVEALGSESLMRRRFDATRRLAEVLSTQARGGGEVAARRMRALDLAGLVVAGGLIETMVDWLEGGHGRSADELVDDFTTLSAATFDAAPA